MKIISLNTWGGRLKNDLLSFVEDNKNIDIFCLQEIYNNAPLQSIIKNSLQDRFDLLLDIKKTLTEHDGYFRPHVGEHYGLSIFIKKDIKIIEEGDFFVYQPLNYVGGGNHARNVQYIKIEDGGKIKNIINFHGLWNGMGKGDTDDRILQSQNILDFIKTLQGDIVLCGDFNLLPETKSLKMFEEFGLINLIEEYNIQSTRTSYYTKPGKFADYAFVSKGVKVEDFKVLPDEVSDHSPLYLEIE